MSPERVKVLTVPFFPYLQPGRQKPRKTKRIRPIDALALPSSLKEIKKSEIITIDIDGKPWSLVSVYSPYSLDVHVMLIETSANRYLSGPERVPAREGDRLMKFWAAVLDLIAARKANATIHTGYNWSPRAWGKEEETNGFQSIPTKWHPQLWGWPSFHRAPQQKVKYAQWVDVNSLLPQEKRLLGDNNYAKPFGLLIRNKLRETFHRSSLFYKLFPYCNWVIDRRGIYVPFNLSVPAILRTPDFFSHVLKPLAVQLDIIMRDLTETLTKTKCEDIDNILIETGKRYPRNWQALRAAPIMRTESYIRKTFKQKRYPQSLLGAVLEPVRNRCNEESDPINWWRKGFGYALVFAGPSSGNCGQMRIMPGVFVGPGGVVETQRIVLRRPEDKQLSRTRIKEKSKVLWQLAKDLRKLGFRAYKKAEQYPKTGNHAGSG